MGIAISLPESAVHKRRSEYETRKEGDFLSSVLTKHAFTRMHSRRVSTSAVMTVMGFGREVHVRGAVIYAIGRNEVEIAKNSGVDLREQEGLHVVCSREGGNLTRVSKSHIS